MRLIEPERLDDASDADAARNLRDIAFLNRWFGGHAILRRCLREAGQPATIVDAGAASGDLARVAREVLPGARIICLDWKQRNLRRAPDPRVVADAFALPFADGAADVVMASLFLHHFEDARVVAVLREFRRVARQTVIVQDLERHPVAHAFLPATQWLFGWSSLTVHDGSISVAAAFKKPELEALAREAGFRDAVVRTHGLAFRLSAILRK